METKVKEINEIQEVMVELGLEKSEQLICACCEEIASTMPVLIAQANHRNKTVEEMLEFDGTFVKELNMFICDKCYIKAGSPTIGIYGRESATSLKIRKVRFIKKFMKNK